MESHISDALDIVSSQDWPGLNLMGIEYINSLRSDRNLPPLPLSLIRHEVGTVGQKATNDETLRLMFFTDGMGDVLLSPKWCAMGEYEFTLCSLPTPEGEHLVKNVVRGGVTCPKCLRVIKHVKAIRL